MIGQAILHYTIISKLGEGGMGVVYKAEDTKLKRDVAIKFLPHSFNVSAKDKEKLKIEAQIAAGLNHSNIATVYAIEEFGDDTFIVMEYVKGDDLKVLIILQSYVEQDNKYQKRKLQERANELLAEAQNEN